MTRQMMMVALDALDIGVLRRGIASGRLPNLRAFIESATEFKVHSDGERLEGTVWPTFTTGTNPGAHGHHWFYHWVGEEARFVSAKDARFNVVSFWKEALEQGKRVVEFDLAYTQPVRHPNERSYNGWGLQDEMDEFAHPESFRKEVRKRHGRSKVQKDTLLVRSPEDRLKLARVLRSGARQRSEVLLDFARRRDWDLLIFGYGEFHLGGHHLAEPMDLSPRVTNETAMYSILKPLDDAWPEIVRAAGDGCDIVIFALHGMQARFAYGEAIQAVLQDMEGRPPPEPSPPDLLRRARNLLPRSIHQAIWLRLPTSVRMQRMMDTWMARMDVHRDRAFMFEGDCSVALRLNIKDREMFGVLNPEDGRPFLQAILAEAKRYRTEDGKQAFVDMFVMADAYHGERLHRLPDATLTYNPEVIRTRKLTRDDGFEIQLHGAESRNGAHTGTGFAFYRPAGEMKVLRRDIDTMDFAPTVLQRIGVTPGAALEGTAFIE
ncbi:MAG: alkaline phosphatase family protein [Dehalococcoidia bacterium]